MLAGLSKLRRPRRELLGPHRVVGQRRGAVAEVQHGLAGVVAVSLMGRAYQDYLNLQLKRRGRNGLIPATRI